MLFKRQVPIGLQQIPERNPVAMLRVKESSVCLDPVVGHPALAHLVWRMKVD